MVDDFGKKNDETFWIILSSYMDSNWKRRGTSGWSPTRLGLGTGFCASTQRKTLGLARWTRSGQLPVQATQLLKARAKKRIEERGKATAASFEEYRELRSSCWLIEERDGDYYCDCPISMKGKLCKHNNGLNYMNGKLEVTSQVRSVPIGQKRKRGRPKNPPSCLTRSPPANPAPTVSARASSPEQVSSDPDSPSPCLPEAVLSVSPESVSPVHLRRSKRKVGASAGLSNQAPPKKKCRTRK